MGRGNFQVNPLTIELGVASEFFLEHSLGRVPAARVQGLGASSAASAANRSPVVPAPAKSASIFLSFSRNWDSVDIGWPHH
jgi:hypothetical protein